MNIHRSKSSLSEPQSKTDLKPSLITSHGVQVKYAYNRNKDKEPKRNKSAFIIFSNQARAKLKAESKDNLNANEIMIKLADLWRSLSKEEKKAYEIEAHNDRTRYHQELEVFLKDNPSKTPKNRTKGNHVKKPCSAYGMFLKEMKDEVRATNPGVKMADVLKIVSTRWKSLESEKKVFFQEKARKEKEITQKKLGEQLSKMEDLDEPIVKKNAQKQHLLRKKMSNKGSKVASSENESVLKVSNCGNYSPHLHSESSDSSHGTESDNDISRKATNSLSLTELENNNPEICLEVKNSETDFIVEILNFGSNIETRDDNVDLSRQSMSRAESNAFTLALNFEIPSLSETTPTRIFDPTFADMFFETSELRINNLNQNFEDLAWSKHF